MNDQSTCGSTTNGCPPDSDCALLGGLIKRNMLPRARRELEILRIYIEAGDGGFLVLQLPAGDSGVPEVVHAGPAAGRVLSGITFAPDVPSQRSSSSRQGRTSGR